MSTVKVEWNDGTEATYSGVNETAVLLENRVYKVVQEARGFSMLQFTSPDPHSVSGVKRWAINLREIRDIQFADEIKREVQDT
jgi:hypothetical protein